MIILRTASALVEHIAARFRGSVHQITLPLRFSERKILLYFTDTIAVLTALLVVLAWRFDLPFGWPTLASHPQWFLLLVGIWAVAALLLDTYNLQHASRIQTGMITGAGTAAVAALFYLAIPYVTPPLHTSRLTAAAFLGTAVVFVGALRAAYAALLVQPTFRHRAVIVGAGWTGQTVVQAIREYAATEYDLVGFIDDDPAKVGTILAEIPVLGTHRDLRRVINRYRVSELILAISHQETMSSALLKACLTCHEQGIQVTLMPALYERLTGRVPVEHAGQALHVVLPGDRAIARGYLMVKRFMDVVIGLVGTILMLSLLPLVAFGQALDSPGPIFYRQRRVGRGGREFMLLKYRTMIPDAETDGPRWTQEDDDRVTRVGRVLRRLHLDELPQAINILRGDMSFIGPRPERPEFVAHLEKQIPFYRARHAVRPGVTGWAQVNYEYGDSVEDALIKLQYDLYYIKHANLWLDLVILARTVGHVLRFAGR